MKLSEADLLFATAARREAVDAMLADRAAKLMAIRGLCGSAPAMLFASLKRRKLPLVIIEEDADSAGYLYTDLIRIAGHIPGRNLPLIQGSRARIALTPSHLTLTQSIQ